MQSELLHNRNRPAVSVANSLNFVANRTVFRQNRATSRCHERFRETLSGSARKIVNQTRGFNLMDKKLIAVAVSSALALPMAAQAVDFSVSGHVNRAIISVDGGVNDGSLEHMDADSSGSRWRAQGSGELDNGLTAGVYLEYALGGSVRQANVSLGSAGGTVTVGHGSAAADGGAHARLGGPSWLGGVTNFCSYASNGSVACMSNDAGRHPVLRYDTPAIGPANIAVSSGNNDYWDAQVSVAGSVGDAGYDVRVAHIGDHDNGGQADTTNASAAVAFGQGTALAVAWSQDKHQDDEYQYIELDHSYGAGSVGVYYKRGEAGDGTESSLWGIGVGHGLGSGTTAYAGYRQMEQEGTDDVTLFLVGMRVAFN